MLINCTISQSLWTEVEGWLSEIGLANYVIDEQKIVLGEYQRSYWINIVLLMTKKVIFNAKLDCKKPRLFSVKYGINIVYKHEQLKSRLLHRNVQFEKRWGILKDYLEEL